MGGSNTVNRQFAREREQTIKFDGDVVIKCGDPAKITMEAAKMQAAFRIGVDSDLFRVPKLLDLNSERGVLRMERIDGIVGIRRARLDNRSTLDLMACIGAALAAIHNDLRLPDSMRVPLFDPILRGDGSTFLHGDFSAENVCVQTCGQGRIRLVILDWSTSQIVRGGGTCGTPLFDVAWFVGNLFRKPVYRYPFGVDPSVAASAFIRTYSAERHDSFSMKSLGEYLLELLSYRLRVHEPGLFWVKRQLLAHGFRRWERFARSVIPAEGTANA